jgi:hypothetical protein
VAENAKLKALLNLKSWPTKHDELMCDPEFRAAYAAEWAKTDAEELKAQVVRQGDGTKLST